MNGVLQLQKNHTLYILVAISLSEKSANVGVCSAYVQNI